MSIYKKPFFACSFVAEEFSASWEDSNTKDFLKKVNFFLKKCQNLADFFFDIEKIFLFSELKKSWDIASMQKIYIFR